MYVWGGAICQCNHEGISFVPTAVPTTATLLAPTYASSGSNQFSITRIALGVLSAMLLFICFCWAWTSYIEKVKRNLNETSNSLNDMSQPFLNCNPYFDVGDALLDDQSIRRLTTSEEMVNEHFWRMQKCLWCHCERFLKSESTFITKTFMSSNPSRRQDDTNPKFYM